MKRPEIITNDEPKRYVIIQGYGSMQERAVARGVISRDFARFWLLAEMAERGRPGETWAIAGPGHTLTAEWLTTDARGDHIRLREVSTQMVKLPARRRPVEWPEAR